MKTRLPLLLIVLTFLLVACQPSGAPLALEGATPTPEIMIPATRVVDIPTTAPQPEVTPTRPVVQSPLTQLPTSCYMEGLPTYVDQANNFCFAYPQKFFADNTQKDSLSLRGPALDDTIEPLFNSVGVSIQDAAGKSLSAAVAEFMQEYQNMNLPFVIKQSSVVMGRETGIAIEPVPGLLSSRVVLLVHGGKLYKISFWPVADTQDISKVSEEFKQAFAGDKLAYEIMQNSFAFLDSNSEGTVTLRESCIVQGKPLYIDADAGICFALPLNFAVVNNGDAKRSIVGRPRGDIKQPLTARLDFEVTPAATGQTLTQQVDAYATGKPEGMTRYYEDRMALSGEKAQSLGDLPTAGDAPVLFAVHTGSLYRLAFSPKPNDFPQTSQDVLDLYTTVTGTFGWIK